MRSGSQWPCCGPGEPYPADSRSDDIWHWQTTLIVKDAEDIYQKLKAMNVVFVSRRLVKQKLKDEEIKSFIVRDDDGHALMMKEYVH